QRGIVPEKRIASKALCGALHVEQGGGALAVGRCRQMSAQQGPAPIDEQLQGPELGFVAHLRRGLDPVTEINIVQLLLARVFKLKKNGKGAKAALLQVRIKKGVNRREGAVHLVADGEPHESALQAH